VPTNDVFEPAVGEVVSVRMRKWDDTPHWQCEMTYLGSDQFGRWLGSTAGTQVSRPGANFATRAPGTKLIPHHGTYLPNFNDPPFGFAIYTDVTDQPVLAREADGWVLRAVDLDLDVILDHAGEVLIDDEDEFEQHIVEFGYPPDVVDRARRTTAELHAAFVARAEPFATVGHRWLSRIG